MHSWVQRPDEERHQEVLKRHGRIPRPLNSFMLYRSAYADRAKLWTAHDNHQTVSVITGLSWNIETPQIRRMYKDLAKIEKRNHARAHPGYHFTVRKRRERSSARRNSKKTTQSSAHLLPKLCQASDTIQHSSPRDVGKDSGHLTQYRIAEHELPIAGSLPSAEDLQRSHIGDLASCDWPSYFPKVSFGQEPTQSSRKDSSPRLATLGGIQPSLTAVSGQQRILNYGHVPSQSSTSGSELADVQSNSDSLSVQYATSPDTVHQSEPHDYNFLGYGQDVGW
ncbi:hypothetical protein CNMCM8980_007235 [Aspergillus fumigatiaffinis]|nr:hypothetical protein CNMCM8980_007235 [Aspergillus fumigatiaffinis]